MPNRSADALFQLVQSLERSEKRNFKLYMTRNTATGDATGQLDHARQGKPSHVRIDDDGLCSGFR